MSRTANETQSFRQAPHGRAVYHCFVHFTSVTPTSKSRPLFPLWAAFLFARKWRNPHADLTTFPAEVCESVNNAMDRSFPGATENCGSH